MGSNGNLSRKTARASAYMVIEPAIARTTTTRIASTSKRPCFANQDSSKPPASVRKSGANSPGVCAADSASALRSWSRGAVSSRLFGRLCSPFFFSQSRQRVLPSETGNPQELHFCTRCIASGTAAGADAAAVASEGMDDAAGGPSANSGGRQIAGIVCSFGALLTLARSGKTSEGFPDSRLATGCRRCSDRSRAVKVRSAMRSRAIRSRSSKAYG